jgi:hypothetical protein
VPQFRALLAEFVSRRSTSTTEGRSSPQVNEGEKRKHYCTIAREEQCDEVPMNEENRELQANVAGD